MFIYFILNLVVAIKRYLGSDNEEEDDGVGGDDGDNDEYRCRPLSLEFADVVPLH